MVYRKTLTICWWKQSTEQEIAGAITRMSPVRLRLVDPLESPKRYTLLPELHADLFSHHVSPLERVSFLLWRSTKQVGVQMAVPCTRRQVHFVRSTLGDFHKQSRRRSIVNDSFIFLYYSERHQ